MNKIGVIYVAWGTKDYVPKSLAPWLAISGVTICGVSVQFAGFDGADDGTRDLLRRNLEAGHIQHLVDGPDHIPETTARSIALAWLVAQGCDTIWLVDSDEMYDTAMIQRIIAVVELNPWVDWWRVSFKNLVFDMKTHLAEPFTPPRIFRIIPNRYSSLRPACFTDDNDIGYRNPVDAPNGTIWPQTSLVSQTVPASWVWVPHITWQNDLRSRDKIRYQLEGRHWPQCQFAWDDQKGLVFNPALPAPKVIRDE